jgi:hypothetical protein
VTGGQRQKNREDEDELRTGAGWERRWLPSEMGTDCRKDTGQGSGWGTLSLTGCGTSQAELGKTGGREGYGVPPWSQGQEDLYKERSTLHQGRTQRPNVTSM